MLRSLAFARAAAVLAFSSAGLTSCSSSQAEDLFGRPTETASGASPNDAGSALTDEDASAGADASTPVGDASTAPDAGSALDAGPPCKALLQEVERLRAEAIACSVIATNLQCAESISDMCCKVWVTANDSKAAKDFEAAVKAAKAAKCAANCANVVCAQGPSYTCFPSSGARGTCIQ